MSKYKLVTNSGIETVHINNKNLTLSMNWTGRIHIYETNNLKVKFCRHAPPFDETFQHPEDLKQGQLCNLCFNSYQNYISR